MADRRLLRLLFFLEKDGIDRRAPCELFRGARVHYLGLLDLCLTVVVERADLALKASDADAEFLVQVVESAVLGFEVGDEVLLVGELPVMHRLGQVKLAVCLA